MSMNKQTGQITPPRRRSLFLRGYDRPPLEGRTNKAPAIERNKRLKILCALLTILILLFYTYIVQNTSNRFRPINPPLIEEKKIPTTTTQNIGGIIQKKIAVAVTVTRDGPYLDGAAVLQHSVRMTKSKHLIEMVAIVHSEVQTTRPALQALGFRIIEFPPPIFSKEIQGQHLRETIDKSGCCGALELLKLCAWKLEEYDWVVSMDMDAIWLANLDHLFEREKEIPKGGYFFTYDFAMDNPGSKAPPVQGGFIAIRPSIEIFNRLVDIVRVGDFRPGSGWGGTNIGWCWGGQTIQGLLAYFAAIVEPSMVIPLDPCVYNSMATTKICRRVDYDTVKTIHYTYCQKPWECRTGDSNICGRFLHAWWLVRQDLERVNSVSITGRCCHGSKEFCLTSSYKSVNIEQMKNLPMSDPKESGTVLGQIVQVPDNVPSREVDD